LPFLNFRIIIASLLHCDMVSIIGPPIDCSNRIDVTAKSKARWTVVSMYLFLFCF
jgi:hypothetical protein